MKQLLFIIVLLSISLTSSAQNIKAITQHGETVVLYDNGTWKYEKDLKTSDSVNIKVPTAPAISTSNNITIDVNKEATSEKLQLYNAVSKKLARFFGEEKGRVNCSATASNNKGEITLNFEFMMPVGDANRYFGYTAQDRGVSFLLADGTTISNSFTKDVEEKFIEKWNVSYYKASIVLTQDDVNKLIKNNTIRMTVSWKKTEEEYNMDQVTAIQTIIAEVL